MARATDGDVYRIKQEVSIKQLLESYGVELNRKGKDFLGHCPMHEDKTPSLVVTPDKNLWNCLGACQTGGSVFDWVMKMEGVSFRHALEILKERQGIISTHIINKPNKNAISEPLRAKGSNGDIPAPLLPKPVTSDNPTKLDSPFDPSENSQELLNQVVDFYHDTIKVSPEAILYLQQRGLNNPEMVDHFKLGLSNRTLGYRIPKSKRKDGSEIRQKLQDTGIMRESGHEHFWGCVVIPIFDEKGNVVEIYGRRIFENYRKRMTFHLYLPGPHRGVWNFSCLAASKEVILCEALIDALTFWCHGFRNVTSSYGVNGFTKDHLEAFKKYGIERVLIAYDRDEAGDQAAKKLSEQLISEGMECFRIKFPLGMDVNEYALGIRDAGNALQKLVRNAEWLGKGTAKVKPFEEKVAAKEEKPSTSILPPAPNIDIPVEIRGEEFIIALGNGQRRWRIRGLAKNMSYEHLKVNIMVSKASNDNRLSDKYFVDNLDLYSSRHRANFSRQAAAELEIEEDIIKSDLGKVLLKLEELQDKQIKKALEPKQQAVVMSDEERKKALELLRSPDLLECILEDFKKFGVVGERTNKLVGYLAAVSRKLDSPLAVIIQSSSAAGKTWLMESVLSFVPDEEKVKYSAMTGQSLFYMGETNIKHKILAIVEEEGAHRTSYALKLLQSEGELSIASTGKDPITGELTTKEYRVEGPVMIFSTTTNIDIDEELQNRCIILTVDESREQTRAIHQMQRARRTLDGLRGKEERARLLTLHCNAQRLLRPLFIINPFSRFLTFLDDKTRTRRDHEKYLTLIDSIALLHQYQRKIIKQKINGETKEALMVSIQDIEVANGIANEVLGRSLDELPPHTRKLLMIIEDFVDRECKRLKIERCEYHFSRRQVREYCGWGNTQLKMHFKRLEEMEYLIVHRGRRGQTFEYELLYDGKGKDGSLFFMGLISDKKLLEIRQKSKYDQEKSGLGVKNGHYEQKKSGVLGNQSGSSRPQVAPKSGGGRVGQEALVASNRGGFLSESAEKGL